MTKLIEKQARHCPVLIIQSFARGRKLRKQEQWRAQNYLLAVIKIQSLYKGYKARSSLGISITQEIKRRKIAGRKITHFARLHLTFTRSLKAIVAKLRVSSAAIKIARSLKRFAIRKLDITDANISEAADTSVPDQVLILVAKRKDREYKVQKLIYNLLKVLDNEVRVPLI